MRRLTDNFLARFLLVCVVIILVLIPFHATLTVGFAHLFGHYTAIRLWKEGILCIAVLGAAILIIRDRSLRNRIWSTPLLNQLVILIALYVVLHLIATSFAVFRGEVTWHALGYGMISDFRYLVFFMLCVIVGHYYEPYIQKYWKHILLIPAGIVITFGLLQMLILPVDALRFVGYGPDTIAPYIAVDQKIEYARAQSTLRGPNPLGAYLVVIITTLVALLLRQKMRSWQLALSVAGTLAVLYGTYSRSAWLGTIASLVILIWLLVKTARIRRLLLVTAGVLLIIGAGSLFLLRDNDYVQNAVFHTDEHSASLASSNEDRAGALGGGVQDILEQPYGRGIGTAGPASVYNDGNVRIAENYFIQIGQEVGLIGLAVFIAICSYVGYILWRLRESGTLPLILFASFIGLTIVNMVSHAWADDTLAYLWWGFAGLSIGAAVLGKKGAQKRGAKH